MPTGVDLAGLLALALSSFVSATLFPGGSEVVLLALLQQRPELYGTAIVVATAANTAGGMTSYLIGRLLPARADARGVRWVRRYGYPALLLSWLPLIGDALCVAAGWLRLHPWLSAAAMAIGKFARYGLLAAGAQAAGALS
ncbi:MAG: DedA family protein [Burkholderiaceae bacterium]|nr:DedA family protein [Burkholderiaceae bacterium]